MTNIILKILIILKIKIIYSFNNFKDITNKKFQIQNKYKKKTKAFVYKKVVVKESGVKDTKDRVMR
jgi:hypothetical protein